MSKLNLSCVDLFAGVGGSSEGAQRAGCTVKWAANHWPAACDTHKLNHPDIECVCQDLRQADYSLVPRHDALLASPECRGHTRARGKERLHHDASRSTAWAVVDCAEFHRPPLLVVENVQEFTSWLLYASWKDALNRLGYTLAPHTIDAADHGIPQHRVRTFIIGTRTKAPVELTLPRRDHVPAESVIDWDSGTWNPIRRKGRSRATLDRIANGRLRCGDRFLIPYYGSGSGLTGRDITRPIGTITTRERWAVVSGDNMRMLTTSETRAFMGFPDTYHLPPKTKLATHLLGNAVCPQVEADILTALMQS